MNLQDKISSAELSDNDYVTFTLEQGTDVFHFNETHLETALSDTDVPEMVTRAITSGLNITTEYGNDPLDVLREAELLEDYERGSYFFEDFVVEAIRDNFWEHELIEESTEKYDHKRGFTTLTSTFKALVSDINIFSLAFENAFSGWNAEVSTKLGQLTFEV